MYTPSICAAVATFLLASTALASPDYPSLITTDLGLGYSPDCSLCHANGQTGFGTVTTPFGASMRARGLVATNDASLSTALQAMQRDKVDSDGDGVTDIDELIAGTDPNGPGSAGSIVYGCGNASVAVAPPRGGLALLWLTIAAIALARLRRRASTERR